ncbi:MAG TPA: hypothetical protein VJZ71_08460 [Phycisphaerae bacterium]|nr:hypothetical protein [Phycisphaerae bacterium]
MHEIHPKILTDDKMQPVAVQIDYADWLEIEKLLNLDRANGKPVDLSRFTGTLKWGEDAVAYQRRVRECDLFPN